MSDLTEELLSSLKDFVGENEESVNKMVDVWISCFDNLINYLIYIRYKGS